MNTTTTDNRATGTAVVRGAFTSVTATASARSWHVHSFAGNAMTAGTGLKPSYKGITQRPPEGSS
jgi:hypothetical protein